MTPATISSNAQALKANLDKIAQDLIAGHDDRAQRGSALLQRRRSCCCGW